MFRTGFVKVVLGKNLNFGKMKMITRLEGRAKVQIHLVANKVNEIIDELNKAEVKEKDEKSS